MRTGWRSWGAWITTSRGRSSRSSTRKMSWGAWCTRASSHHTTNHSSPQLCSRYKSDESESTFFGYVLKGKKKYPDAIALVRNGEFYETYGIDALMLIAYAGLKPMGGAPRAGCPSRNVQATLDDLTDAGLSVAVHEQVTRTTASSARGKMKDSITRGFTQMVSPGQRTYLYGMCLRDENVVFPENMPYVGLLETATGYTMCEVHVDERYVCMCMCVYVYVRVYVFYPA